RARRAAPLDRARRDPRPRRPRHPRRADRDRRVAGGVLPRRGAAVALAARPRHRAARAARRAPARNATPSLEATYMVKRLPRPSATIPIRHDDVAIVDEEEDERPHSAGPQPAPARPTVPFPGDAMHHRFARPG